MNERIEGYADALFSVAKAEGNLDEVEDELFRFARSLEGSEELRGALTDELVPADKRHAIIEELLGGRASPTTVQLVNLVVGAGRGRELPAIIDRLVERAASEKDLVVAGVWSRMRWVTIPSISPVILFAVVIGMIQALQYFTQAYVAANVAAGGASQAGSNEITVGYPENSTLFFPVLLYQHGFRYFNMGYASAMAMVLLGAAFVLTLAIILTSRKWVHYQGATR